jgi:hypothetical protein
VAEQGKVTIKTGGHPPMKGVWVVIERPDGAIEEHIGPLGKWARSNDTGKVIQIQDKHGKVIPVFDSDFHQAVLDKLMPFDGQNARDVAKAMTPEDLRADSTLALRKLAAGLANVSARVIRRQDRAEAGRLFAVWLADIELAQMKIRVIPE